MLRNSRFLTTCIAAFVSNFLNAIYAGNSSDPGKEQFHAVIPSTKLVLNSRMRDPSICLGGDGYYYLTGTTGGNLWTWNEGIELWRSKDLVNWEPMGLVWSIEKDGTWQKEWTKKINNNKSDGDLRRVVWAPEIHYLKGTYWIPYCMPSLGMGLLKSTSGKPEGPYASALVPDEPLLPGLIDASIFEDDDGQDYFLCGAGNIARMKPDMSGLAEELRQMRPNPPDLEPAHHTKTHCKKDGNNHIGFEGPFMFKARGRYYMACAESYDKRYSTMIASSEHIYGPYGPRQEAIPKGGHATFFQDDKGKWWSACFSTSLSERASIVPIELEADGSVKPLPPP